MLPLIDVKAYLYMGFSLAKKMKLIVLLHVVLNICVEYIERHMHRNNCTFRPLAA